MDYKIKPRHNLQLRKVGRLYMMVEVSREQVNMTNVFTLNETAALLWQRVCAGAFTPAELARWLCSEFRVDADTALHDVCRQLDDWKAYGLIDELED